MSLQKLIIVKSYLLSFHNYFLAISFQYNNLHPKQNNETLEKQILRKNKLETESLMYPTDYFSCKLQGGKTPFASPEYVYV